MTARPSSIRSFVGVIIVLVWCAHAPVAAAVGMDQDAPEAEAATRAANQAAEQATAPAIVVPPPGVTQELVLRDGSRAFGRIDRIDGPLIVFKTITGGVLEVDAGQIVSVKPVTGRVVNGAFLPADSNTTRLFFGPTARTLPRGSGYVAVYELLLPFVQVGITDRISLGVGTPLVFGDGGSHPFWISPKVQVLDTPSTQAALGAIHFMNIDGGALGVAYGVVTHGSGDLALTYGLGYAYERESGDMGGGTVVMIGGERRVSRRLKLVTENYIFSRGGIGSFGVRFLGDRLSADLGLGVPIGDGDLFVFPMVNFVWRFGKD